MRGMLWNLFPMPIHSLESSNHQEHFPRQTLFIHKQNCSSNIILKLDSSPVWQLTPTAPVRGHLTLDDHSELKASLGNILSPRPAVGLQREKKKPVTKQKLRAKEMAQWLRTCTVLPKDLCLIPGTRMRQLTDNANSGRIPYLWPL